MLFTLHRGVWDKHTHVHKTEPAALVSCSRAVTIRDLETETNPILHQGHGATREPRGDLRLHSTNMATVLGTDVTPSDVGVRLVSPFGLRAGDPSRLFQQ